MGRDKRRTTEQEHRGLTDCRKATVFHLSPVTFCMPSPRHKLSVEVYPGESKEEFPSPERMQKQESEDMCASPVLEGRKEGRVVENFTSEKKQRGTGTTKADRAGKITFQSPAGEAAAPAPVEYDREVYRRRMG